MVVVRNLVKNFGARRAVDDVSFEVQKGTVLGFLGPNGAGKSTTMRMITGFLTPTSGSASIQGHDVQKDPVSARKCLGYLPENAPSYGAMTVEEFLSFAAAIRGYSSGDVRSRVDAVLEKCFLGNVRHQTIETLSKGYRQRTCMAQALIHDPPVLIMDEPTDGLDPNQKKIVRDMIQQMAADKVIILSTHVLEEVEAMCNRVVIISRGRVVADSTPGDLRKRSAFYNAVSVDLAVPADEARDLYAQFPDVDRVTVLERGAGHCRLEIFPKAQQPIARLVVEAAIKKGWQIASLNANPGKLDDVFRSVTSTEDVVVGKGGN